MRSFVISFLAVVLLGFGSGPLTAQEIIIPANATVTAQATERALGRSEFHKSTVKAINNLVRKGEMKWRDGNKLKRYLLAPAFQDACLKLALTQMHFSGGDLPRDADGKILVADINWQEIIESFLEKLIPILERLLEMWLDSLF